MYIDHIEKKVDPNTRTSGRKDRDLVQPEKITIPEENDAEAEEVRSRGAGDTTSKNADGKMKEGGHDKLKYNIPDTCIFNFLKQNLIERLNHNYVLVTHPFPTIEGELLIY